MQAVECRLSVYRRWRVLRRDGPTRPYASIIEPPGVGSVCSTRPSAAPAPRPAARAVRDVVDSRPSPQARYDPTKSLPSPWTRPPAGNAWRTCAGGCGRRPPWRGSSRGRRSRPERCRANPLCVRPEPCPPCRPATIGCQRRAATPLSRSCRCNVSRSARRPRSATCRRAPAPLIVKSR